MATVTIIGASRGVGLETVKAALAAGHTVRALARSATNIPVSNAKLEKITGDALKAPDVAAVVTGADAVIQAIGVSDPKNLIFGTTFFSEATRVMVRAMQDANVKRLIAVTGAGAGNSRGRINFLYDYVMFPVLLARVYSDKDIAEEIIQASGLDWTIVRPGLLTNGAATGRYHAFPEMKDWRAGFISRSDVADFLVKQVSDRSMVSKTPLLIS